MAGGPGLGGECPGWLVSWLVCWLVGLFVGLLVCWLVGLFVCLFGVPQLFLKRGSPMSSDLRTFLWQASGEFSELLASLEASLGMMKSNTSTFFKKSISIF